MRLNKRYINKIIVLFLICFIIPKSYSQNNTAINLFDSANYQYSKGNYEKAIQLYESVLNTNIEAAALYFNLGNAYYKNNQIGLAILYYEKAKKISSNDEDIEHNLMLANLKTEDKVNQLPELFLTNWINNIANLLSEKSWSIICIIMLCASLVMFAFYFSTNVVIFKKIFFYIALILFIKAIVSFFLAQHQYSKLKKNNSAIIINPSSNINSSPSEKSTKLFILHEGTKVDITDEDNDWMEIKLSNGNVGWVKKADLGRI